MGFFSFLYILCIYAVSSLTPTPIHAEEPAKGSEKVALPPCPSETKRVSYPLSDRPHWMGCKDKAGLYQGLIIQFSNQFEIIRIAGVKNSLREGKEIRFGKTGTLEERSFTNGHLHGSSDIYKSVSTLGKLIPQGATTEEWLQFTRFDSPSLLKKWLKTEPESHLTFENGRIKTAQYGGKIFTFTHSPEGRIFSDNHPEMKGGFFIDPEILWTLSPPDLKSALFPGFGSCKKYMAPIGRLGRYYEKLFYKRERSEQKHLDKLNEMFERFRHYCVPQDLMDHLGETECPPQLPSPLPFRKCFIPISDRLRVPYEPKYFKFDFTLKRSPEAFFDLLKAQTLMKWLSRPDVDIEDIPSLKIQLKKTSHGILYKSLEVDPSLALKEEVKTDANEKNKDWWMWKKIPGL